MKAAREHRVPIMMTAEELEAVDEFRFANRIATRSGAIRCLARLGIAHHMAARAATETIRRAGRASKSPPSTQRIA